MALIQIVARQALLTFKNRDQAGSAFTSNFQKLKTYLDLLTANDINLDVPTSTAQLQKNGTEVYRAPVSYIHLIECPYFTMGVFILRNGASLPLHDHPGMYGMCRILYGSARIRCYDNISKSRPINATSCPSDDEKQEKMSRIRDSFGRTATKCRLNSDAVLTNSCVLTPSNGNYHLIEANNGAVAFLDILSPPYSTLEGRDCAYYRESTPGSSSELKPDEDTSVRWLVEIPQPIEFYCDSQPYKGPPIDLDI